MPRYIFERNSIVSEAFTVDAASEEEALELVQDGQCETQIVEFIDWASDGYDLVSVEDELVTFIQSKEVA